MKKTLPIIIFLFSFFKISACSCTTPNLALEFLESKHVFLGKVISKEYSDNYESFKIVFQVIEHFKKGKNPKTIEFSFINSKIQSSCDWKININERWLIFSKNTKDKLWFSGICSNSRAIYKNGYPTFAKQISYHWKNFNIDKFIFSVLDGHFETSPPKISIDSLIRKYYKKDYGNKYEDNIVNIIVDIDRSGKLIQAVLNEHKDVKTIKYDSIFHLQLYQPLKHFEPRSIFQKDILNEIKKIKIWNPAIIKGTTIVVPFRKHLQFNKTKDSISANYNY